LPPSDDSKVSLRQLLFRRFGVIAVFPLVLLILLLGRTFDRTLRTNAEVALEEDARDISALIDGYLVEHQRDLVTLARADPDRLSGAGGIGSAHVRAPGAVSGISHFARG